MFQGIQRHARHRMRLQIIRPPLLVYSCTSNERVWPPFVGGGVTARPSSVQCRNANSVADTMDMVNRRRSCYND